MSNTTTNTRTVFDLSMDARTLSKSETTGVRVALGVSGLIALALGVIVLVWPDATVAILGVLFGLYFLISGIVHITRGLFTKGASGGSRVLNILLGVLLGVGGIVAIKNPLNSLVILGMLIGISWIVEGVAGLVETAPDSSRWIGTIFGAIAIIAGTVVLFAPVESISFLVIVGGIFLVLSGFFQIVQAFMFGRGSGRRATSDTV
ncbi:hypothetical protein E3T24_14480 [Cryobacterium sp. TmT2-59]|uniref:HdeD family acid-resistance protein n=2 Tax=unclassified Cryobacterium TaxID=2649013 RepID=UPI00106CB6F7|nr:DUF308 domain-containing protein [Cryobacterium sp. TmT2-59]TFC81958.1 hypothetical protein E3T24_14480 [Cryobacterium sp. TmT2-59]TFD18361.1 hypothetical protein E3T32_12325 [Cryobacterium sp. TMT2-23]